MLPKTWEAVATRQNWAEEEVAGGTANFQHWKAAEVAAMIGEVAVLPVAAPLLNTVRQAGAERLMLLL